MTIRPEGDGSGERLHAESHGISRQLLLGVLLPVVVLGGVGVAGGALWAWWADPPGRDELTPDNLQVQLGTLFGVELRYAGVALVLGGLVGGLLSVALRRVGWLAVLGLAVGGGCAAATSYWTGVLLGPAAPVDVARTDLLSGALVITAPGVFLAWPVAAVAGCWLVTWLLDRDQRTSAGAELPDLPDLPTRWGRSTR